MQFPQVGVSLYVLAPGEPIGMYHDTVDEAAPQAWRRRRAGDD
jgi:hypothetical protein